MVKTLSKATLSRFTKRPGKSQISIHCMAVGSVPHYHLVIEIETFLSLLEALQASLGRRCSYKREAIG